MSFESGTLVRVEGEAKPYSAVDPDFFRIYRFTQTTDLVLSRSAEVDRTEGWTFETSISELSEIFDGSEELISVIRLSVYLRETFLP